MLAILQSTRPRTLVLSVSSILTPERFWRERGFFLAAIHFLMLTSCLLQILSNLVNEYGDWKKERIRNNRVAGRSVCKAVK